MTAEALIFTLSALGISETVYLIRKRMQLQKPVCIVGEDCSKVLESRWNKIFGIHNDILGLLFYIACSIVNALLVIGIEPVSYWTTAIKILLIFGSLMSLFLTYLQSQVIKAWCFWCLMSACTIWLMGIIMVIEGGIR